MDDFYSYFIEFLSCCVNQIPISFNYKKYNITKLYNILKSHSLEHLLYNELKLSEIKVDDDTEKFLYKSYRNSIKKSALYDAEAETISRQFYAENIPFLFLKGSVIRKYYPEAYMRTMSDMDILIPQEQRKNAYNILIRNGYKPEVFDIGEEDVYSKPPYINIELHTSLIPCDKPWYSFFKTLEKEMLYSKENINENLYLYFIAHTAKHFKYGGIGARNVIDIFYLKKECNLDENYIDGKLKELKLFKFAKTFEAVADCWFNGKPFTHDTEKISEFIITSGTYGTVKRLMLSDKNVISGDKKSFVLKRIFPSKETLATAYPVLTDKPFLLPAIYVIRIFKAIFFKNIKLKTNINSIKNINEDDIKYMIEIYKTVGFEGD